MTYHYYELAKLVQREDQDVARDDVGATHAADLHGVDA